MIVDYSVYDGEGRILRSGSCPDSIRSIQAGSGEFIYPFKEADDTHYIDTAGDEPIALMRPEFTDFPGGVVIKADGKESLVIVGLPMGTEVTLEGIVDIVDDGEWEVTVDQPGSYLVEISRFPYLDKEVSFEAVAPV